MKNTINVTNNTEDRINGLEKAQDKISNQEDKVVENNQAGQSNGKQTS